MCIGNTNKQAICPNITPRKDPSMTTNNNHTINP